MQPPPSTDVIFEKNSKHESLKFNTFSLNAHFCIKNTTPEADSVTLNGIKMSGNSRF